MGGGGFTGGTPLQGGYGYQPQGLLGPPQQMPGMQSPGVPGWGTKTNEWGKAYGWQKLPQPKPMGDVGRTPPPMNFEGGGQGGQGDMADAYRRMLLGFGGSWA